jgi:hypothetical protein
VTIEITPEDREAAAKALGYRDYADATDYRLTGDQDRQVKAMVKAFAQHRHEAMHRARPKVDVEKVLHTAATKALQEHFGYERYARDYEYLNAQFRPAYEKGIRAAIAAMEAGEGP